MQRATNINILLKQKPSTVFFFSPVEAKHMQPTRSAADKSCFLPLSLAVPGSDLHSLFLPTESPVQRGPPPSLRDHPSARVEPLKPARSEEIGANESSLNTDGPEEELKSAPRSFLMDLRRYISREARFPKTAGQLMVRFSARQSWGIVVVSLWLFSRFNV